MNFISTETPKELTWLRIPYLYFIFSYNLFYSHLHIGSQFKYAKFQYKLHKQTQQQSYLPHSDGVACNMAYYNGCIWEAEANNLCTRYPHIQPPLFHHHLRIPHILRTLARSHCNLGTLPQSSALALSCISPLSNHKLSLSPGILGTFLHQSLPCIRSSTTSMPQCTCGTDDVVAVVVAAAAIRF